MKKIIINIPKGIRYLGDWEDFKIPNHPCIIDKQIPGCGFTEGCILNSENVILCSPRRILLENKRDQHVEDVLYISSSSDDLLTVDKDISSSSDTKYDKAKKLNNLFSVKDTITPDLYENVRSMIIDYIDRSNRLHKPYKILVTYDSYRIVKRVLRDLGRFLNFRTVVDEFQSIFTDSRFKSDTEMKFVDELRDVQRLCYVSATPMIDEYLEKLDEFKDLPYYELDWEKEQPERIMKPKLTIRTTVSAVSTAKEIIKKYKLGKFETKYVMDDNGNLTQVESREAVIYLNSLNNIISIINKSGLTPEEVNILCANTPDNRTRINKKLGKGFTIGTVPLVGEQHKMFTFCTRTVYLGADFYSTNARTFIISDANIDSLAVDISLDLPQILGRQRLDCNPWKNEACFYYKSTVRCKTISREQFDQIVEEKLRKTESLISASVKVEVDPTEYKDLMDCYEEVVDKKNYKDHYLSINSRRLPDGSYEKYPVLNKLVLLAEQRAFDIQQVDYADRFSVFNTINITSQADNDNQKVVELLKEYKTLSTLKSKLEYLSNVCLSYPEEVFTAVLTNIPDSNLGEYVSILGPIKCKKLKYEISLIKKELGIISIDKKELDREVYRHFLVNEKYSLSAIKGSLKNIYVSLGYNKTPKATDLANWFNVRNLTYVENGKRIRAYEILSKKF